MPECNHEEADTTIVVHVLHALRNGAKTLVIRTVDTDVVVVLLGKHHQFLLECLEMQIWIGFGMGKNCSFYHINRIYAWLGNGKCQGLSVFHALTGCDTTNSFWGKGKKSAWQAWDAFQEITTVFCDIAANPFRIINRDSENFKQIERFIVIMYDKTSLSASINDISEEVSFVTRIMGWRNCLQHR